MTNCVKCGRDNLDWVKTKGKWKLFEPSSGQLHVTTCQISKGEYHALSINKVPRSIACAHGILKTRSCDQCDDNRRELYL